MKPLAADLPIRPKIYTEKPALIRFTPCGGCCKEWFPRPGYGQCSGSGGAETPETFFEPSHWWAHDYREVHVKDVFEGVPYIDTRHMEGTAALIDVAFNGPLLDVTLPPGTVSRFAVNTVSPIMAKAMEGTSYGALLALHLANEGTGKIGSLDTVSTDLFMAIYRKAGAIVGEVRAGKFVPFA